MDDEDLPLTPYDYACWKALATLSFADGYACTTHWLCARSESKARADGLLLGAHGLGSQGLDVARRRIAAALLDDGYSEWREREIKQHQARAQLDAPNGSRPPAV